MGGKEGPRSSLSKRLIERAGEARKKNGHQQGVRCRRRECSAREKKAGWVSGVSRSAENGAAHRGRHQGAALSCAAHQRWPATAATSKSASTCCGGSPWCPSAGDCCQARRRAASLWASAASVLCARCSSHTCDGGQGMQDRERLRRAATQGAERHTERTVAQAASCEREGPAHGA